jgi:putative inorganic carbon (HCO3(-)) transporter
MNAYASAGTVVGSSLPGPRPLEARRWDLAFFGLLFYLIVEYTRLGAMYPILGQLHVGKISVAMCALGLVLAMRVPGGMPASVRRLDLIMILFTVAVFISTLFAEFPGIAWDGFLDALRWLAIYFLISRVIINRWRLRIALILLLLLNLKMAQFVVRLYFEELALGRAGWALAKFGVGAGSTGYFSNASDFGVAMCVVWPIAATVYFGERKNLVRMMLLAAVILFLAAILVCGSRGALVGAAAVGVAALLRNPNKTTAVVLLLLLSVGVVYFLPDASKERMESGWNWQEDDTASHRVFLWKGGMRIFADHPLFGVGPDNFARVRYLKYHDPDGWPRNTETVAHNTFVQSLADLGAVGTGLLFVLFALFFRLNHKTRKQVLATDPLGRKSFFYCLSYGLDLALVGFMVTGFFVSVLFYPHIWILLGISVALYRSSLLPPSPVPTGQPVAGRPAFAPPAA